MVDLSTVACHSVIGAMFGPPFVCLFVGLLAGLMKMLLVDFHEIWRLGRLRIIEQLIKFCKVKVEVSALCCLVDCSSDSVSRPSDTFTARSTVKEV